MKFLLVLLCLVVNVAFAKFPMIDVKGINGDYLDEKGRAHAEKAYYVLPKVKLSHQDIQIDFDKKDSNLVIRDPNTTVTLEFDFSFLSIFKAIGFENVNLKSDEKLFTATSDILDLYIKPKKYQMSNILVQTDVSNIPTSEDEDIDILDGLLLTGKIIIEKMTFKDYDVIIFDDFRAENPQYLAEINAIESRINKMKIPLIVRHLKFSMDDGSFTGKAKLDSYINLWLRLNGSIKVNKEKTLLTINLATAKLGIFSFRKTLLRQVKKLNLETVTVVGNNILVDIDN